MFDESLSPNKVQILLSIFFVLLFCSYYHIETSLIKSGKYQNDFYKKHTKLSITPSQTQLLQRHSSHSDSSSYLPLSLLSNKNKNKISANDLSACKAVSHVPFRGQAQHDHTLYEKLFSNPDRCGGTIIEIGAIDGAMFSNSWFYEKALHWKSILIEPQPDNYKKLMTNRPNAINIQTAVCDDRFGDRSFRSRPGALSGLVHTMSDGHKNRFHMERDNVIKVPCTPFSKILHDHSILRVDILFVDVEGAEIEVLQTMDWNVPVLVWIVELDGHNVEKDMNVRNILHSNGYCKVEDWDIYMFCTDCVKRDEFYMQC